MAKSIGADGHVLAKHTDPETRLPRKLIVAAKLKDPALERVLSSIFREFGRAHGS